MERACSPAGASPAPSGSCTDASDDSVDVRVRPVALPSSNQAVPATILHGAHSNNSVVMTSGSGRRNKRKLAEPRRLEAKRAAVSSTSPCRTAWGESDDSDSEMAANNHQQKVGSGVGGSVRTHESDSDEDSDVDVEMSGTTPSPSKSVPNQQTQSQIRSRLGLETPPTRTPGVSGSSVNSSFGGMNSRFAAAHCSTDNLSNCDLGEGSSNSATMYDVGGGRDTPGGSSRGKQKQRNYKNMTRERRVEANARERTRVHTISAAFDSLRRAVPAYSYNQKLSKLAILKIACSYILALASLTEQDYSLEQDKPSFSECVDLCTRTIQNEGRARRRKE